MSKLEIGDLNFAANILEHYYSDDYSSEDPEGHAQLMRVVAFLDKEIAKRETARQHYAMRKAYADEHGVSIKRVKIVKGNA